MSPQDVARALEGDRQAMQALVERLLPVIQTEVAHALLRDAPVEGRDPRQEVRGFVQEVFVQLLSSDGRSLRAWDPERGRSLDSDLRLIARRQLAAILRSGRKSPWADEPVASDELEQALPERDASGSTAAKLESAEELDRVFDGLSQRLDERGMLVFRMLYIEERSVEEVMAATAITRDAVYAWRSRFRKIVAKLATPSDPRGASTTASEVG